MKGQKAKGKKMKTKIILTSISALMMSVAGARAMDLRPFVGIALGISDINYSSEMDTSARISAIDLPTDFFAFGIEGGFRFGEYNKIYNGGMSLNFDMTDAQKITDVFTNQKYGKLKTFAMSATYDNYIRISGDKTSRIDLVLGAGLGTMNYNIDYEPVIGASDDTIWSTMFAFKAGLDFGLTQNVILSATARTFIPTRSHYAVDAQYVFGGAIRYQF